MRHLLICILQTYVLAIDAVSLTFTQIIQHTGVFVSACVCVCWTDRRDKVLIKPNSVNLSSRYNQLPQCALSSPANGCFVICYVDWYTHTSLEKWISGIKEPLLPTPMHPPVILRCKKPARYIHVCLDHVNTIKNSNVRPNLKKIQRGWFLSTLFNNVLTSPVTCCCLSAAVFQVLHCCVSGSNLHTQQSNYLLSLSDLSADYDLMLGQVNSFEPPPSQATVGDFGNLLTVAEGK